MPELDTITVKGFKSIASIEKLKLGAINVLIGPNGSGKSNFIGVFRFLQSVRRGRLQEYAGKTGIENLLHFGPKITPRLSVGFTFARATCRAMRCIWNRASPWICCRWAKPRSKRWLAWRSANSCRVTNGRPASATLKHSAR